MKDKNTRSPGPPMHQDGAGTRPSGVDVPLHLNEFNDYLSRIAPKPGSLVYLKVSRLRHQWKGWRPVIYSSLDVCTHLQIARMYLMPTNASALEMVDFLLQQYPFPVKEIRTSESSWAIDSAFNGSAQRLTFFARTHGIRHSIADDTTDFLLHLIAHFMVGAKLASKGMLPSPSSAMEMLIKELYFFNNHLAIPQLGGRTPLQQLRSFAGFEHTAFFDPYRDSVL